MKEDGQIVHVRRDVERERRPLPPRTVALLAVAVVFGLLLWAKLLLVTGHPRTALADPDASSDGDTAGLHESASASAAD